MEFLTAEALTALLTLTAMEIVLGIDNIVFISIVVARAPAESRTCQRGIHHSRTHTSEMRCAILHELHYLRTYAHLRTV